MSGYAIVRFDNIGARLAFTANVSGGDLVNLMGSTTPSRTRQGVSIVNSSASETLSVYAGRPSEAEATVDDYGPVAIVPPNTHVIIGCNGSVYLWGLSQSAGSTVAGWITELL